MITLSTTYRPKDFDDVLGHTTVVTTLRNAIARNIIGHAYLFSGPRGTGKTTLARIFAQAVNCTPREDFTPCDKNVCEQLRTGQSLDLIEIDAASHTGVDTIRALRDTVTLPPHSARYKVYIIDEAHMLSTAAWNALLKTLEEPPSHALFLFATTDAHKIPQTILSRVQRFDLSRLDVGLIAKKLRHIAKRESLPLTRTAAAMIARSADGSMRDAESLLAQCAAMQEDSITDETVQALLGIADTDTILTLLEHIIHYQRVAALETLATVERAGVAVDIFARDTVRVARHILLYSIDAELFSPYTDLYDPPHRDRLIALATQASPPRHRIIVDTLHTAVHQCTTSPLPIIPLEIAIVALTTTDTPQSSDDTGASTSETHDTSSSTANDTNAPTDTPSSNADTSSADLSRLTDAWNDVLSYVRKRNAPFGALLRTAAPHSVNENTVTLVTANSLLCEKYAATDVMRLTLIAAVATILPKCTHVQIAHADTLQSSDNAPLPAKVIATMRGAQIIPSGV